MKIRDFLKRKLPTLLALLLAAGMAYPCCEAAAAEQETTSTLRIQFEDGTQPIGGAEFSVYRVADVREHGGYDLTGPFAGSGAVVENRMQNDAWVEAAQVLADCAEQAKAVPEKTGTTDDNGELTFEGLAEGLYLVKGSDGDTDAAVYHPQAFCVKLPDRDTNAEPVYQVKAEVKYESEQKLGCLKVSKAVTGAGDKKKEWHFTVTLDPAEDASYGGHAFQDGVYSFTLKDGESILFTDIPYGTAYKVTEQEANKDSYKTTAEGAEGTISGFMEAKFTNSLPSSAKPSSTVKTGDQNRTGMWTGLACAAALGVLILLVDLEYRKDNSRD